MYYRNWIVAAGLTCLGLNVMACGTERREVEVTGTVSAPSSLMLGEELLLDFFDVVEGEGGTQPWRGSVTLAKPGDFARTLVLAGDEVLLQVFDDRDGNDFCSEGEASGEALVRIEDDKAENIAVTLAERACPLPGMFMAE